MVEEQIIRIIKKDFLGVLGTIVSALKSLYPKMVVPDITKIDNGLSSIQIGNIKHRKLIFRIPSIRVSIDRKGKIKVDVELLCYEKGLANSEKLINEKHFDYSFDGERYDKVDLEKMQKEIYTWIVEKINSMGIDYNIR